MSIESCFILNELDREYSTVLPGSTGTIELLYLIDPLEFVIVFLLCREIVCDPRI